MRHRRRAGLLALNIVLLGLLGVATLATRADAQDDTRRPRGEYTMVSGEILGIQNEAIYLVDAANNELFGVYWQPGRRQLEPIGYRDIALDAERGGGRR